MFNFDLKILSHVQRSEPLSARLPGGPVYGYSAERAELSKVRLKLPAMDSPNYQTVMLSLSVSLATFIAFLPTSPTNPTPIHLPSS